MLGSVFLLKITDAFFMGNKLEYIKPLTEEKKRSEQIRNDIFFCS